MIKISLIENEVKEFHPRLACGLKEQVREVGFGVNDIKQTVRLCSNCIEEILSKIGSCHNNLCRMPVLNEME